MAAPIRITIYGPDLQPRFVLGEPSKASAAMRWHSKATATFTLPWDHPRIDDVLQPGVVGAMDYFVGDSYADYADPAKWRRLVNGPIWDITGEGPSINGVATFTISDALWVLMDGTLAWPNPTLPVTGQTSEYRVISGPLETVTKTLLRENALTRLGNPITVETSSGRGATVSLSLRFDRLSDALQSALMADDFGLTATLRGGVYAVEAWTPVDRSARVVTEATGMLTDWQLARSGPVATRAVAGGAGTGTARVMGSAVDAATEAAWGLKLEVYTGDNSTDLDTTAEVDAVAQAKLDESLATAGVSAELAEVGWLRYGRDLWLGDIITVAPTPELTVTDRITSCTITYDVEDGLLVIPTVGDDSIEQGVNAPMVAAITKMARSIRKRETR